MKADSSKIRLHYGHNNRDVLIRVCRDGKVYRCIRSEDDVQANKIRGVWEYLGKKEEILIALKHLEKQEKQE